MLMLRTLWLAMAALAVAVFAPAPSSAQNYPTQRVTIVVPFGAGSVTDIMARILADELAKRWNQQVIVENRPGLAGTAAVAKAAPDGYTLMLTSNGHTVAALVSKNVPFDPVKDFAGVTRVSSSPLSLIVYPGLSVKTVQELIANAKANPGKLNFSSPGLASTTFIAGALFRKATGINIVHVPYKSVPEAVSAVIRGDAHMYFAPTNVAKEQGEAGKVNVVGSVDSATAPGDAEHTDLPRAGRRLRVRCLVRPHGACRRAEGYRCQNQPGCCGDSQVPGDQGEACGAVIGRCRRHARAVRQDHPR